MANKITIFLGIAIFGAVLFGGLTFSQSAFAGVSGNNGQEKVTICHVDQKTGEEKTITVGAPAVEKHLANHEGDHLGECGEGPEPAACQDCYDAFSAASLECQGIPIEDCLIPAHKIFAECTLTCEGIGGIGFDIPQECSNEAAPALATCLEEITDPGDWGFCDIDWQESILSCVGPV